jgi:hypothetical protein
VAQHVPSSVTQRNARVYIYLYPRARALTQRMKAGDFEYRTLFLTDVSFNHSIRLYLWPFHCKRCLATLGRPRLHAIGLHLVCICASSIESIKIQLHVHVGKTDNGRGQCGIVLYFKMDRRAFAVGKELS